MTAIAQDRVPNILLVMADQLRRDALGVHGSWAPTPHLDELARSSTVFDRAVTTSPTCQPARLSLAMGQYPHNFGLWDNGPGIVPHGAPTWMAAIRDAGYHTSVFGKLHLGHPGPDLREREDHPRSLGFDVVNETLGPRGCVRRMSHMVAAWEDAGVLDAFRDDMAERVVDDPFVVRPSPLPLDLYYDVWVPRQAAVHIEALPRGEPWFCVVSFGGPHEPWDTPEPYASMFHPRDAPPPIPPGPAREGRPPMHIDSKLRLATALRPEAIAAMRANYAGAVALIDDQVGELIETVRRRGEWDATVVVVTSDHGEMNGDHGLVYKSNFFEQAVAIPLMVRLPGVTRGSRTEALAELHDVGPTLAEVAGASLDFEQFGRSLVGSAVDPSRPGRDVAVSEFRKEFMVSDGRHKLIVNRLGDSSMLVDTAVDPREHDDLLPEGRADDVEMHLRDRLLRFLIRNQKTTRSKSPSKGIEAQIAAVSGRSEGGS